MSANDKQIGGAHYKGQVVEHWDFVLMHNIPYLEAVAMKYIMRHAKKGGREDLEKAIHYIEKILETSYPVAAPPGPSDMLTRPPPSPQDAHAQGGLGAGLGVKQAALCRFDEIVQELAKTYPDIWRLVNTEILGHEKRTTTSRKDKSS